jgi:hypothetical protein
MRGLSLLEPKFSKIFVNGILGGAGVRVLAGEPDFLLLITLGYQMLAIHKSFNLGFESRLGVTNPSEQLPNARREPLRHESADPLQQMGQSIVF